MTMPACWHPEPVRQWYRGVQFRSQLEARWAAYFCELGIPWRYEVQGYTLQGRRYLPDFELVVKRGLLRREVWFAEVKYGGYDTRAGEHVGLLRLLAAQTGRSAILLAGAPRDCAHLAFVAGMPEGTSALARFQSTDPKLRVV